MVSILKIRFTLFSIIGLAVIFFVYRAVVPFGKITYKTNACNASFFIQPLQPKDRLAPPEAGLEKTNTKNCVRRVIGEPVYFNVNTQRTFNSADVTLTYRLSNVPVIEAGVLSDERKNYALQPLQNAVIDGLDWSARQENGVTLWQRDATYDTIDEFLQNPPDKSQILTYHYNLSPQSTISGYRPNAEPLMITRQLRGAYQFYTYVDGAEAEFELLFRDLNQNKDADDITVILYDNQRNVIAKREIADERGQEQTRTSADVGGVHLELAALEPGFYTVAVVATDDTVTRQILSSQKIVSFINRLWLADSSDTELITLYTDAGEVTASTINPAALQNMLVNKKILSLSETYRQFSVSADQPVSTIEFARDDVIISGSGVFSFSPESLYNPAYRKLAKNQNLDGVNYIITSYRPNSVAGEWQTKKLNFDLKNAFWYERNYGFIISAPGLIAQDDVDNYIEIKSIEVELRGRTLIEKIKEKLGN